MKLRRLLFMLAMCFIVLICNKYIYAIDDVIDNDIISPNASSSTITSGDYEYIRVSGGIYIVSYLGEEEVLSISSTIDSYSVKGLYSECFASATNLKKVIIPETVNSIYTDTFLNCRTLETIEVSSDNETYASYDGMLYSKDYVYFVTCPEGKTGEATIKSGAVYICDNSFFNASKVTSINIPSTVMDIGSMAFEDTNSLESFVVSSTSKYFTYSDGILYDKNKTELIKCVNKRINCINIANTVKTIRDYAFSECNELLGPINLPSGLTSIGENAFFNCNSLTGDVIIPDSVTSIGKCAFYGCNNITSLTISNGITTIPEDCFEYCFNLKEIVIPNSVKEIGDRAFFDCSSIEKLDLGIGVTKIGNWAFDYLTSLKEDLIIPDSVISIGDCAFHNSPLIDGFIVIGSNVSEIGVSAFYNSQNTKGIVFKGSLPSITDYTFLEPRVPYYYLEEKSGFVQALYGKDTRIYSNNPVVTYMVNNDVYNQVELSTYGISVNEFADPNFNEYEFKGWYYDENFEQEYNFSDIIMNDTTLYAKLESKNRIEFNESELLIEEGKSQKLVYSYMLESGASINDISWESSNTEVASIDENGNVNAISEGETTITASYKDATAQINVIVFKARNSISFSEEQLRVVVDNVIDLRENLDFHLLDEATFEDIVWTSSNEEVATVLDGKVTAISEGNAIITASYEDVRDTIEIQVVKKNKLEITTEDFVIKSGKNQSIEIDYYFNDGATNNDIVWTSSNASVATIENGTIIAKLPGEVTVTASYKDAQDSIKITVVNMDEILFENTSLNIENTIHTYDLAYTFYSYDYDIKDIVWSSSNNEVATIENGTLNIISNGQTIITGTLGDATDTIIINVVDPNRLNFRDDYTQIEYRKNPSINLNIDYYFNDGGSIDDIVYESDNSSVIRVVNNKIVVSGIGNATLKASYKDMSDTIEIEVVSIDKLSFNKVGYIMEIGERQALDYSFDSYEGDIENIVFYSTNTNVIKIENGNIFAVGKGRAKVVATYGDMTSEIVVIVADNSYLLGDLNFDGIVNANDSAVALDIYKYGISDDIQILIGDINFDNVVNANDAALILDIYKYGK